MCKGSASYATMADEPGRDSSARPAGNAGSVAERRAPRKTNYWKRADKAVINAVSAVRHSFAGWHYTNEVREKLMDIGGIGEFTMSLEAVRGEGLILTIEDISGGGKAEYNYNTNTDAIIKPSGVFENFEKLVSIAPHVTWDEGLQTRYDAYIAFGEELDEWVAKFNEPWKRQKARLEATHQQFGLYSVKEAHHLTGEFDRFKLGMHDICITVVYPGRKNDLVYLFQIDYFGHTVEDKLFFYRTRKPTVNAARRLIKDKYPTIDGKTRTLMGMLSDWSCQLCDLGTQKMGWVPTMLLLSEEKRSGKKRRKKEKGVEETEQEPRPVPGRAVLVQDAWKGDDKRTSKTLKSALGTYAFLEGKAARHGRYLGKALREHISKNGYYAFMAAGNNLEGVGDPNLLALRPMVLTDICI